MFETIGFALLGLGSVGLAVVLSLLATCVCWKSLQCFCRGAKGGCRLLNRALSLLFSLAIILIGALLFYVIILEMFHLPFPFALRPTGVPPAPPSFLTQLSLQQ